MKYLIINADDFGLSPGVNQGIVEAYQAGGISSTTLMVNMPGLGDAVRLAGLHPELGVGLHFNLTYGRPISDPRLIPSLVQADGRFHPISAICSRELRDIEIELSAQWNRFIATGLRPTHLDAHHHLHQTFPEVYEAMARLAAKENIPMRKPQLPYGENEHATPLPLTVNHVLLDTYENEDGLQKLLSYLRHLPDGSTEIMCHPGYVDETLRGISQLTQERESELMVFRNPAVSETIRDRGIRLIHYGLLGSPRNERDLALSDPETQSDPAPSEDTGPLDVPIQPPAPTRSITKRRSLRYRKLKPRTLLLRRRRRRTVRPRRKPRFMVRKKREAGGEPSPPASSRANYWFTCSSAFKPTLFFSFLRTMPIIAASTIHIAQITADVINKPLYPFPTTS